MSESLHHESLSRWGPVEEPSNTLSGPPVVRKSPSKKGAKQARSPGPPLPASSSAAAHQSGLVLHDHYILMQRARAGLGTEHVYKWFDHFLEHAQPWVTATVRKRKALAQEEGAEGEVEGELTEGEMLQMRCRFHTALSDLLHTGVISLRHNGTAVSRQCFSWMAE